MCRYWKKQHTCSHPSDRPYIEMCRPGFLSNTVCPDISEDPVLRPSHFPCWWCIKALSRADTEAKRHRDHVLASAAESVREVAIRARFESEKRMREERVRRDAREKAELERAAEQKVNTEREKETERAKKEGGAWMLAETGSGKKKKRGSMLGSPASAANPSIVNGAVMKDTWKENGQGGPVGKSAWKDEKSEANGRAGLWGPKRILSRKEGAGVVANLMDVSVEANGTKK